MDCEACTDRMVELLYEELPDADAEAARSHLSGCEACTDAFARISTGQELASMLPFEEPPERVRSAVMAAARAKAVERAPAEAPAAAMERTASPRDDGDEGEDRGLWASILHWLGGFAMRPQLAMAMTLLLMVGIGLWYLDVGRRHDPADSQAIVDPAPGDEVGPSRTLAPAEPLDLEADPRTGRIRPRDAVDSEPVARRQDAFDSVDSAESAEASEAEESTGELAAIDGLAEGDAEGRAAEMAQAEDGEVIADALESPETAMAELDIGGGESFGADDDGPLEATDEAQAQATGRAYAAGAVREQPMPEAAAPSSQGGSSAGSAPESVRRPETDTRQLLPPAMHQLARNQRAEGNCRAAVRTYERLLSQYRTYGQAPEAMIEAAGCYRRIGQLSAARRWLEQASRTSRVRARAQRALAELSTAERAHDRATSAAEAEAAPE